MNPQRVRSTITDAQFTDRRARALREIEMRRERGEHHVSEVAHAYGEALPVDATLERTGPMRYAVVDSPVPWRRRLIRWLRGVK